MVLHGLLVLNGFQKTVYPTKLGQYSKGNTYLIINQRECYHCRSNCYKLHTDLIFLKYQPHAWKERDVYLIFLLRNRENLSKKQVFSS